jgi:hypothetical protein
MLSPFSFFINNKITIVEVKLYIYIYIKKDLISNEDESHTNMRCKSLGNNVKHGWTVLPTCKLIKIFLLKRAMPELQILYQTYFSETNLRKRKNRKKCP